ncbi:MAG: PAS domain-containing protein [Pleurocapsa sp.]
MQEHQSFKQPIPSSNVDGSQTNSPNSIHCNCAESERILREQLEHFLLLSTDLLCIAGFDGYFKCLNPAWSKTLGYTNGELLAKPYLELVHPEDLPATIAAIQQLETGCNTINFQNRYRCRNDTYRWLSWKTIVDPQQQLIYCVTRDITENKYKEKKLQESEAKLRLAFEAACMGSWNWNIQTDEIKWSSNLEALFGLAPGEFDGSYQMFVSTIHPEDRKRVVKTIDNCIATRADYELEFRIVYPNGQIRWALSKGKVFYDQNGQPSQMAGVDIDITERKQLEERLRQNEERWQLALKGNNDGIWDWKIQTDEVFFSTRWKEMLGYKEHEITNHLDEWSKRVHPEDLETAMQDIQNHLARKTDYYINEHRILSKDGSYKWILDRGQAVWNERGNPVRMVGSHTDITERKRAEAELKAQILRSQLFADIALKIRQSLQLEDILKITVDEIQKLLNADRVLILRLKAPNTLYVIQENVKSGWDSIVEKGFVDDCLGAEYLLKYPQGRLYSIADVEKADIHHCLTEFLRQFQVKSKLVIPLLFQEKLWGTIVIHQCSQHRYWSSWEIDILQQIADQIAIALGQSYLVEALANFSTNLKHLHRINTTNYASFDDLFADCLATGCEMFDMSTGIISQIEGESYKIQAVRSPLVFLEVGLEFEVQDTYCAAVVQENRTITYTRVSDIESMQTHPVYQNLQLESYIGTPIFVNGAVYGTLNFSSIQPRVKNFQSQELEAIELMAQSIGKFIAAYQTEMQRQQAELALRESEARFRTMADSAPVLLWISGTDKQCTFFNQFWLKFTGRSLEQELGNGWAEGVHPHDFQHCLETYETAFDRRELFQMEYRLRRADGQYRWLLDSGIPRITSNGDFLGYIGSCIDISDRKQNEETLRKQAAQQAVIAELGQYALTASDLDSLMNQIAMASACTLELECCKILELLPEQNELLLRAGVGWQGGLVGRATVSRKLNSQAGYTLLRTEPVIVRDLRTETRFNSSPLLHQHKIISGMSIVIHGKNRPFGVLGVHSTQARTFSRDDINFLQAVANILSTAIEQKQAEIALQNSEQRWATLTETVPVGIFIGDVSGNCLYVNHSWSEITGMTIREASGKGWIEAIYPDDRDRILTEWYRVSQHHLPFRAEYRLIHHDGQITWVYGQAIPEIAADESITGYIGTVTDITERLKIEEIKRALEREKELSALKLRFFSMASHEFRTPLSIITFATQILENSEPEWLDEKKIRNIYRIKNSAQKITQMLTDVLILARAEAEKLEVQPTSINLKQFCLQVLEEINTTRQEDRITLTYQGHKEDKVYLDEQLLHSILINLLSNAVKYSPQTEKVIFEVHLQVKSVIFTIKDQGIGITPQDKQHLFEAFHRGENVGTIDGTGLGLAIVKRCVDLQGGTITYDSCLGTGTTVVVSIPLTALAN